MGFAARLLAWFHDNGRDLPWRRTRDPWAIWVSEIMLQQTRVEAVRDSYQRFLARFPRPADLAAASDDELMLAWRGLGYYRRARLLRDGARTVMVEHGGVVPATAERLGRLPGIGSYTRGAIASIAFDEATPAVDGNVERIVARRLGLDLEIKTAVARTRIADEVLKWLDGVRAGDLNQALMDLGAMICTPRAPRCSECPVAVGCIAHREGTTDALPVRKPPRPKVDISARAALIRGHRGALGARVPDDEPNAGQIELPGAGILRTVESMHLAGELRARYGADLNVGPPLGTIRHTITHHRITFTAHAATIRRPGRLKWFPMDDDVPWTTAARKMFRKTASTGS
ncbi:MAG: A/G-specific adenine glycosylase [Planctomycetes bacterium]|nr:A/G-specific adenine glycosylase [Planctomycetota bacterium]